MASKGEALSKPTPNKGAKTVSQEAAVHRPAKRLVLGICLLLAFVFYGNTLTNGYSLDDELVTLNQKNVEQGISGIPAIFTSRYSVNDKQNYEYRPVTLTTFALEYQLFGRSASASHFFNVLLYALAAFLVYQTLLRLFPHVHWSFPLLSTLIFLIHPLHSEVVASLKNRDEILAFVFALLSLNAFVGFTQKGRWWNIGLGILYFLLALLSKKSCVPYLFIIPFTLVYVCRTKPLRTIGFTLVLILVSMFVYGAMVKAMLTKSEPLSRELFFFENPLYEGKYGMGQRLMMAISTFGFYIKMALVPYPLVSYYGYNSIESFGFGIYHMTGIAGFLLLGFVIYKYWYTSKPMVWGAIVFVAGISMFTNLLVPAVGIVAERFAFESTLGLSVLMAGGLLMLFKHFEKDVAAGLANTKVNLGKGIKAAVAVLTLVSAVVVIVRNTEWKSHYTLYQADVNKLPRSAKLNSLMGTHFYTQLRDRSQSLDAASVMRLTDSSMYYFKQGIRVYPRYASLYNNIGTLYINWRYNLDSCEKYFNLAITADTDFAQAMGNYASVLELRAMIEKQKLDWINFLPAADSSARVQPGLDHYNQVFEALGIMKRNLEEIFFMVSGRKLSGKENIHGAAANAIRPAIGMVAGNDTSLIRLNTFMLAMLNQYNVLGRTAKYSRVRFVTDSVTAAYFNPVLSKKIPVQVQQSVNGQTRRDSEQKLKHYQDKATELYVRSIAIKNDDPALYAKAVNALQQWGRYDGLITIYHEMLGAKHARKHMMGFLLAGAYMEQGDYENGTLQVLKALDETARIVQRTNACINDFTGSGNQFTPKYLAESKKVTQDRVQAYTEQYVALLQAKGKNAEAGKIKVRTEELMKTLGLTKTQ